LAFVLAPTGTVRDGRNLRATPEREPDPFALAFGAVAAAADLALWLDR